MEKVFILIEQSVNLLGIREQTNIKATDGMGVLEEWMFGQFNNNKDIEVLEWDDFSKLPLEIENTRNGSRFFIQEMKIK